MNDYLTNQLQEIGCTNTTKAILCVHVYIELTEVKKYWNVKFCHNTDLDTTYITAQKNKKSTETIIVPIAVADSLSFVDMNKYFNLRKNNESIYLGIIDADSTSVYYKISEGIAPPSKSLSSRSLARDKREYNNNVFRKNAKIIQEAALCGMTIDLTNTAKSTERSDFLENIDDSD